MKTRSGLGAASGRRDRRVIDCNLDLRECRAVETLKDSKSAFTSVIDSPRAWLRLSATMLLSTIGGVGMWSVVVALPAVQSEFGVARDRKSVV